MGKTSNGWHFHFLMDSPNAHVAGFKRNRSLPARPGVFNDAGFFRYSQKITIIKFAWKMQVLPGTSKTWWSEAVTK